MSAVAPSGTGRAMSQLTTWAPSKPMTIVSWLSVTSRPRMCAGATSAMYMGERFEAMPIATPPKMRNTTNQAKAGAQPVSTDETANSRAAATSSRLRPNLSLRPPVRTAPARQPSRAQLFAQPRRALLDKPKKGSKNGFAPPITTQS